MSENLTPQQRLAVENRGGKLLVSAAAGSGKTKVLVDRLMSYLTDPNDPANLDDFLIITYTKAAASELRAKISDKLTKYIALHPENRHMQNQIQRLHLARISTVHGFCADILREYAYKLDIPADFRIAEESECHEIMFRVLRELLDCAYIESLDDDAFRAFIDTQGLGRDDRQVPEIVLQIYSSALCHLDPNGWLDWCIKSSESNNIADASETIWGAYLITELKEYLSLQIESLERCIHRANTIPGLEKPVLLLKTTVEGLHSLQQCNSWDEIAAHPPVEYGVLTFKKEHKNTKLAEEIKAIRNYCKENLPKKLKAFTDTSDVILSHLEESALATKGLIQLVKAFRVMFDKQKRARKVLDFSDIEQITLDLLLGKQRTGITAASYEIGNRFREIMVDEYQDSNEVQDAIFTALTTKRHNCFMVGDVKQSIYQFRLADPDIFLEKYNTFQPAESTIPGDGKKVMLSSNFRSSAGVISAVNDVFSECMSPKVGGLYYGEDEMLREGIPHVSLPETEVELYGIDVAEDTYREEATFTAQHIRTLLDGTHMIRQDDQLRPIVPDDIVILLRSPGSVGGDFRYALELEGIPCTMGTDSDLLQLPEVETLRSLLQIIHNPMQDIPLLSAIASPVFGFTADDLAGIRKSNKHVDFYQLLKNDQSPKSVHFILTLNELRKNARFLTVTQLIHQIFIKTDMLSIYGAMVDGEEKVRNLQNFCQISAQYEATGRKELSYFLDHLTAMEEKGLSVTGSMPSGAVRIMSIHKSKGLEFPVVFLCGLSRSFNTSDIQKQVLCHKDLGLGLVHTNAKQRVRFPTIAKRAIAAKIRAESISEELRVLYVAMTRARDRLIMTYAGTKLEERLNELALRLDMSARDLLTANVTCPGSWILITALQRTESGEFFNLSTKPDCSRVSDIPWSVHVVKAKPSVTSIVEEESTPGCVNSQVIDKMRNGLCFHYSHQAVTATPSKLTATQLKGRVKDDEAAEFTPVTEKRPAFRSPKYGKTTIRGTEFGTAMHSVMQYLNFQSCNSQDAIQQDVLRMVTSGLISQTQADCVGVDRIAHFFQTDIGVQLITSKHVLREFKFSILVDAADYYPDAREDKILLQGVVDCALLDDDGITVLDFKTDTLSASNKSEKIALYRNQVQTYARALSKIYELPIKASYIYFFSTEEFVLID